RMHGLRYDNMRRFVSWLAAKGPFRPGIGEEEAAAIVWTLAGPEVNRLLRTARGWSRERYVAWLADTLVRPLLPDDTPRNVTHQHGPQAEGGRIPLLRLTAPRKARHRSFSPNRRRQAWKRSAPPR